jgi:hypothetical protein
VVTNIALSTTLLAGLHAVNKVPDVAAPLVLSVIQTRKLSLHVIQYTVDDDAIWAALKLINYLVAKQLHPHVISMSITLLIRQVDIDEVGHFAKSAVVEDVVAIGVSIGKSLFTKGLCNICQQRGCNLASVRAGLRMVFATVSNTNSRISSEDHDEKTLIPNCALTY